MPERDYMVVDPRRDHSIRIPRPDLSDALDSPNACGSCHGDPPKSTLAGGSHGSGTSCKSCHSEAYKNGVLDPAVHINGKVEL